MASKARARSVGTQSLLRFTDIIANLFIAKDVYSENLYSPKICLSSCEGLAKTSFYKCEGLANFVCG